MATSTTLTGAEEVQRAAGTELGVSDWHTVTPDEIKRFADATGDQGTHTGLNGPGQCAPGVTVAQSLLPLSLGPMMTFSVVDLRGFALIVNYGYANVRFPAPLSVGCRVRMRATLTEVRETSVGLRLTITQRFELEGQAEPVCLAEWLSLAVAHG